MDRKQLAIIIQEKIEKLHELKSISDKLDNLQLPSMDGQWVDELPLQSLKSFSSFGNNKYVSKLGELKKRKDLLKHCEKILNELSKIDHKVHLSLIDFVSAKHAENIKD